MKKILIFATITALVVSFVAPVSQANATITADMWRAERIIDDVVFTNASAMTVGEIDTFLKKLLPTCDRWGVKTVNSSGLTRAQYALDTYGVRTPFTCLTDYYEIPKTAPSTTLPINNYGKYNTDGSPYVPAGAISVAQMIYNAGQKYQISPQALIIKLATESPGPLTRDDWPMPSQYYYAMGAHCPDDGPGGAANCRVEWSGFSLQMDEAANLLRGYLDNMDQSWWPYKRVGPGVDFVKKDANGVALKDLCSSRVGFQNSNCIGWNVPASCGGTVINIQSKATAALYTYTPYQPNQAALLNMYGTGDACSAYGNRNFWRVWNDWFGSTVATYTPITPEWMQVSSSAQKMNPQTGSATSDAPLATGSEILLTSKITTSNGTFYRTQYDTNYNLNKAILAQNMKLKDFVNLSSPMWIRLKYDSHKQYPYTGYNIDNKIPAGTELKVTSKIDVGGSLSYRTEYDTNANLLKAVPSVFVEEIAYQPFQEPRWMRVVKDTAYYDPFSKTYGSTVLKGQDFKLSSKVDFSGKAYSRTSELTSSGSMFAIPAADLAEIPYVITYNSPIRVTLTTDVKKISPTKDIEWPGTLLAGSNVSVSETITVNGITYVRSSYDAAYKLDKAFPINSVRSGDYLLMTESRKMKTTVDVYKVNPKTGQKFEIIKAGSVLYFVAKYSTTTDTYLRTEYDNLYNLDKAIPISSLVNV